MFVILLAANFKFRNRSTCSKRPMKRACKVCGDFQDLKLPGMAVVGNFPLDLHKIFTVKELFQSASSCFCSVVACAGGNSITKHTGGGRLEGLSQKPQNIYPKIAIL